MIEYSNGYLEEYLDKIKKKEILAGHELTDELKRLVKDMDNPRYIYNSKDADNRIDFMENCIRLTKSPFYGKPMKLMLWQKAFISAVYSFKMADHTYTDISGKLCNCDRFQKIVLLIARKNSKALALNTRIPTPDGDKTMSDIHTGDYVFNEHGQPVKVIGESEIFHNHDCYKFEFEDGDKIICDAGHLWCVDYNHSDIMTAEQMYTGMHHNHNRYFVPVCGKPDVGKRILHIEKTVSVDTKCIHVEGERGLFLCGNKNTVTHNSETCSALGLTESIIGNEGSDIVCSSNDDNQANILYDSIDTMRSMIDPNDRDSKKTVRNIVIYVTNSKIFKISDRTRNKEGRNIDFAIIDEVHEMKNNVIIKSIEQSQSLKDNPKCIIITTEGFVNDGALDEILIQCRKIISGEDDSLSAERILPWLYTQDSENEVWNDPKTWIKSNPSLGTIKKWSYLETQVDLARKSRSDRMFVLAKDFNFKQNSAQAWLNTDDYIYDATFDPEDFHGAVCLGAVDLAETTDMTSAKILLMRKGDKTKYVLSHYWIPENKLRNSDDETSGAKYVQWSKEGKLTVCEGNDVDLSVVADWFYMLYKIYGIRLYKCGYDQKFSKDFLRRMEEYGFECDMVLQNKLTLSNAMKLVEQDLKSRYINYNNHEIDRWCLGNAAMEIDNLGNVMAVKIQGQATKRIDGAVTFIILYEEYRRWRSEFVTMLK